MSLVELPKTIEPCHALILQQAEINQQQAIVIQEQQEIIDRLQDDANAKRFFKKVREELELHFRKKRPWPLTD